MKKSIIAASAASLAVAAMPIVGVFAASGSSFTDTLTVGVQGGCTIENAEILDPTDPADPGTYADRTFSDTIAAGTVGYLNADATGAVSPSSESFTVTCNTEHGTTGDAWSVTVSAGNLESGANTIAPGSATSGDTSAWALKSNVGGTDAADATDNYASYTGFSNTTLLTANIGKEVTFNPSYRVFVAPGQAVGNYTGTVTYTVVLP